MAVTPTRARMAHAHLERLDAEGKLDEGLRYEVLNGELVIRGASPEVTSPGTRSLDLPAASICTRGATSTTGSAYPSTGWST